MPKDQFDKLGPLPGTHADFTASRERAVHEKAEQLNQAIRAALCFCVDVEVSVVIDQNLGSKLGPLPMVVVRTKK